MAVKNDQPGTKEVHIEHLFDASCEQVFKAWSSQEHLAQWFAPKNCTIAFKHMDFREGGSFHYCIYNPQYPDCWCGGEYKEIVPGRKLVFTVRLTDEQGNPATAATAGKHPDWPEETLVTVTFTPQGKKTKLVLHQAVSESLARITGAYPSWLQMLERLESLVPTFK